MRSWSIVTHFIRYCTLIQYTNDDYVQGGMRTKLCAERENKLYSNENEIFNVLWGFSYTPHMKLRACTKESRIVAFNILSKFIFVVFLLCMCVEVGWVVDYVLMLLYVADIIKWQQNALYKELLYVPLRWWKIYQFFCTPPRDDFSPSYHSTNSKTR